LTLNFDEPLSNVAFNLKLRCYNEGCAMAVLATVPYTLVGRRMFTLSKPVLKLESTSGFSA